MFNWGEMVIIRMCGLMLSKEGVTPIKDVRNDGVVGKEEGGGMDGGGGGEKVL